MSTDNDTPSDDELREWKAVAEHGARGGRGLVYDIDKRMVEVCDALLAERRAHSETRRRLSAALAVIEYYDLLSYDPAETGGIVHPPTPRNIAHAKRVTAAAFGAPQETT